MTNPQIPQPGGTPYADDILNAACLPADDRAELDIVARGFMENFVRIIVSLLTTSPRIRSLIFETIIANPRFTTIVVDRARDGLADDLRAPRTVVHEVDLTGARILPTYDTFKVATGSSRIAIAIGAVLGFIAGVVAMMMFDASPVMVGMIDEKVTFSVVVAQAVDQPWFIATAIVLSTLAGAVIGSLKQKFRTVQYVTGFTVTAREQ